MKVGDYVRTEDGIKKVLKYTYNEKYENGHCVWFDNKDYGILYTDEEVNKMKPSSNIKYLIEAGDYVNGRLVHNNLIYLTEFGWVDFDTLEQTDTRQIKSIVTKEQFSCMEYKVGDINGNMYK